jgi:hypothetical protein
LFSKAKEVDVINSRDLTIALTAAVESLSLYGSDSHCVAYVFGLAAA